MFVGVSSSVLIFCNTKQIIIRTSSYVCRPLLSFRGHAFRVSFIRFVLVFQFFRLAPHCWKESSLFIPSFREFLFRRLPTATCRPHVGNSLHFHRSVLTNKNLFESFQWNLFPDPFCTLIITYFFYLSSTFRKKIRLFLCNFSIDSIYFFDFNILLNYFSCEIYSICARERKENATYNTKWRFENTF